MGKVTALRMFNLIIMEMEDLVQFICTVCICHEKANFTLVWRLVFGAQKPLATAFGIVQV